MKKIITLILLCAAFAKGAELTPGYTFADGNRINADQLRRLVADASINSSFYSAKLPQSNIVSADIMLVLNNGIYHQVLAGNGLFKNPLLVTAQTEYGNGGSTNYYLTAYDTTNNLLFRISLANLFATAPLNYVTNYLPLQPDPNGTNQVRFYVWDTNNAPGYLMESNLLSSLAPSLGTNALLPYNFNQFFYPWKVYGTNNPAVTNAWGYVTNFPISSLFVTNAYNPSNTLPTLTNVDTIPIYSTLQQTNTVITLGALLQKITNDFNLFTPVYTNFSSARISFGIPVQVALSPVIDSVNGCFLAATSAYITSNSPTCVSFATIASGTLPGGLSLNTPYYVSAFTGNGSAPFTNTFRAFRNYQDAVAGTNFISPSTGLKTNFVNIVPAFSSYNCGVIQLSTGTSPAVEQAGQFAVNFHNALATTNYYVSGSVMTQPSGSQYQGIISADNSGTITTTNIYVNTQRTDVSGSGAYQNYPRAYILISPE